jgi:molybdenum cofactor cytidylyltransferase
MSEHSWPVAALLLAAGLSRRMGQFKLLLPWDGDTVIGRVLSTICAANLAEVLVVTGHRAPDVATALSAEPVRLVFNSRYTDGEMIGSIQVGLGALGPDVTAALLCLGDQPQMQLQSVQTVLAAGEATHWGRIIIPSYQMRAGHPVLLPRLVWPEVLRTPGDLRAVMAAHRHQTDYVPVESSSILSDLDTPEDYRRARAEAAPDAPAAAHGPECGDKS